MYAPTAMARRHGNAPTHDVTIERTRNHSEKPSMDDSKKNEQKNDDMDGWRGGFGVYFPSSVEAPDEGIEIAENDFSFAGLLFVRPTTNAIIIHHVGVPDGDTSAEAIHSAHLSNGWAGIGYHYVIRQDGTIERGRPLVTVGAHAYMNNIYTVGVCLSGNFEDEYPTDAQIDSLVELLASLCRIYHLAPSEYTIMGHMDVNSDTLCPGEHLYEIMPSIIGMVRERL